MPTAEVAAFTVADVGEWLAGADPEVTQKTIGILEEEEINGRSFLKLTVEDMKELGLRKGARDILTELLAQLGTPPGTPRPAAGGASAASSRRRRSS